MVFSSLLFLLRFCPAALLLYYVVPGRFRNFVLFAVSLFFYAWGEPVYVCLILFSTLIDYTAGRAVGYYKARGKMRAAKAGVAVSAVINLGLLGTFKYTDFFLSTVNEWMHMDFVLPHLALPIGISFYTFQTMSYTIDVYRGDADVQKNFITFGTYVSLFPQLIAGPIIRYKTVEKQLTWRKESVELFADGIFRFTIGLGKKVLIANQIGELWNEIASTNVLMLSTMEAWLGAVAFTLQIYFDFSGYSDMAIGLGRCIGFHFNENFDHPYCCTSITDFWRRWHISLGSFFRDYVYIPLGGNRKRQAINILSVWFLTGMWHGASWNFIIWGVYFGIIVMLEKHTILKIKSRGAKWALRIYALLLVVVGWGIFYFDDFDRMGKFFRVFSGLEGERHNFLTESAVFDHFWLWVLAIALCMPLRKSIDRVARSIFKPHKSSAGSMVFQLSRIIISLVILIVSVALLVGATNNAFIYTRF